jgi:hypothetical protein
MIVDCFLPVPNAFSQKEQPETGLVQGIDKDPSAGMASAADRLYLTPYTFTQEDDDISPGTTFSRFHVFTFSRSLFLPGTFF